MQTPLPFIVCADFECINQPENDHKVLYKQIPIAVGYHSKTPFGNQYYSFFSGGCVKWSVNELLTLKKVQITISKQIYYKYLLKKTYSSNNPTCVGCAKNLFQKT